MHKRVARRWLDHIRRAQKSYLHPHYDTFIRFGKFTEGGTSKVFLDEEFVGEMGAKRGESGLSVYFAQRHKDGWYVVPPNRDRASYGLSSGYMYTMVNSRFADAICRGHIFLVGGDLVPIATSRIMGYSGDEDVTYQVGTDGEPVITHSKKIKQLDVSEVYVDVGHGPVPLTEVFDTQRHCADAAVHYAELGIYDEALRKEWLSVPSEKVYKLEDMFGFVRGKFRAESPSRERVVTFYSALEFVLDGLDGLWKSGRRIDIFKYAKAVRRSLEGRNVDALVSAVNEVNARVR